MKIIFAGVRYLRDNTYGNCSVLALQLKSFGAEEDITAMNTNGSFILHIKNPLQLFKIDSNFTYVGKVSLNFAVACSEY